MEKIKLPLANYSAEQKLDLMEELWCDLTQDETQFSSPAWHEDILKEREEAFQQGKIKSSDWEEAKVRIKKKVLCK